MKRIAVALCSAVLVAATAHADFVQQLGKLVGTGTTGINGSKQGFAVALSADGNTMASGSYTDGSSNEAGAVWVFTRSGGAWTQQGSKLVGANGNGVGGQGYAVALSADGNTLLVGGPGINGNGAMWVFTRSGGTWTQQGNKLVGTGQAGGASQGTAVALSADGNTALVGGTDDNNFVGAAWVFTRSGGVWTQQGSKLIGSGAVGQSTQGYAVALSADGNTAVIGGNSDNSGAGAAWVFTRSGGVWSQQGSKLIGSGATGAAAQGAGVALSADGNTAIIGGPHDNSSAGAIWAFTRSGSTWTQQGAKLVGTGGNGTTTGQGTSVALSSSGDLALVGGPGDHVNDGALWTFTRSGGVWTQQGSKIIPNDLSSRVGYNPLVGLSVALSADGVTAATGAPGDAQNSGAAWSFAQQGPGTPILLSSILPTTRAIQMGKVATAFATVLNTGGAQGISCGLAFGPYIVPIQATLSYQTTNPATNAVTGSPNTPANIPAGGSQSFVFAITPASPFSGDLPIAATCNNAGTAPEIQGVTTLGFSASANPVPDIIALAASVTPGYVIIPGDTGTGAFSVATVNVGATAQIQVKAQTSGLGARTGSDPTFTLCQTNAQAQCINPTTPASFVNLTIATNETPTFSIFVKGTGPIPDNPAYNRVFVLFTNLTSGVGGGGGTSVAVKTQ